MVPAHCASHRVRSTGRELVPRERVVVLPRPNERHQRGSGNDSLEGTAMRVLSIDRQLRRLVALIAVLVCSATVTAACGSHAPSSSNNAPPSSVPVDVPSPPTDARDRIGIYAWGFDTTTRSASASRTRQGIRWSRPTGALPLRARARRSPRWRTGYRGARTDRVRYGDRCQGRRLERARAEHRSLRRGAATELPSPMELCCIEQCRDSAVATATVARPGQGTASYLRRGSK
jgi:hypothetical protein